MSLCSDFRGGKCQAMRWDPKVTINIYWIARSSLNTSIRHFLPLPHTHTPAMFVFQKALVLIKTSMNKNEHKTSGQEHLTASGLKKKRLCTFVERDCICQENWHKAGGMNLELRRGNDDICMAVITQENGKHVKSAFTRPGKSYEK